MADSPDIDPITDMDKKIAEEPLHDTSRGTSSDMPSLDMGMPETLPLVSEGDIAQADGTPPEEMEKSVPVHDTSRGTSSDMPSINEDIPEETALEHEQNVSDRETSPSSDAENRTETAVAPPPSDSVYRVLARKYRPQTFSQLIGQDAMVQTLANAIKRDRLAHAFLMTGVRGVGKTSTARLIAKALNCIGPDGQGGPTIDPCGVCEPCRAIAEGRHIDVIEMDAASHTGVDDVREIIEAVRYAAVSARYKIYIIDEVHMLSKNAFNALLKTLEEPPAHVKFLFATTEVGKVPITVLSRCQRFDLKRITSAMLEQHFAMVCQSEGVPADGEAITMIAQAAEGSVRDGLSILDQAIAHADMQADDAGDANRVTAAQVRDMLGLSDRGAVRRLLGHILKGDAENTLAAMDEQHVLGVEPLALIRALMDYVHQLTLAKIGPLKQVTVSEEERADLTGWSKRLSNAQLHRFWQLLLKGHDEVQRAPMPQQACQMALLRLLHAADMPDPAELVKRMAGSTSEAPPPPSRSAPAEGGEHSEHSTPKNPHHGVPGDYAGFVNWLDHKGNLSLAQVLHDWVRVVEYEPGTLVYQTVPSYTADIAPQLRDTLMQMTGQRWRIEKGDGEAQMSLGERADAKKQAQREETLASPMVQAARAAFPDARLLDDNDLPRGNEQWSKTA